METLPSSERWDLRRGLPILVGVGAVAIYVATLNHWLTLQSLPVAAEVNGWYWEPTLLRPVLFLLTRPLTWLPAGWEPVALNLFTALCGSLTLGLLARSVALLPHDRIEQQRILARHERALLSLGGAWVPPVLAAVALGLQLTFWENATAVSGEMLDLLLFAGVIWCVLEYRVDPRRGWLDGASLICGLAFANSWGMIVWVPLFAVVLVRVRGLKFFNRSYLEHVQLSRWQRAVPALASDLRFLARMAIIGLAGTLLVLALPLAQALSPDSMVGLRQGVSAVAGSYKMHLVLAGRVFLRQRDVALLLGAVTLVPVLLLSIRWRTFTGREGSHRFDPMALVFYVTHAFLLLLGVWIVFDPPISPRQISLRLGVALPFLPLYYLVALSIGYYSGFFLLIFSGHPGQGRLLRRLLHWAAPVLVYLLLAVTLAGLVWRNGPLIRATNGRLLDQYARLAMSGLPPAGGVVMSEDPSRLAVLRAALARHGQSRRYMPVDANALPSGRYRAWLKRHYPKQWVEPVAEAGLGSEGAGKTGARQDPAGVLRVISGLAQSNRVFYLHIGFGAWFEQFCLQPRGLIYELKPPPADALSPRLTAAELAESKVFWQRAVETGATPVAKASARLEHPQAGLGEWIEARGHLRTTVPRAIKGLALWYSGALNCWGVTLQRNDQWREAAACFALAGELNPDNLPAQVNLQCNSNLLAGRKLTLPPPKPVEELLGKYRGWSQVLAANGPFDEPGHCYQLGASFAQAKLWRQAAQQLERVVALAPGDAAARVALADSLNRLRMPGRALEVLAGFKALADSPPADPRDQMNLAFVEADAWFGRTNEAKAAAVLEALLESQPGDPALVERVKAAFSVHQSYTNALRISERQLVLAPDNVVFLQEKGDLYLQAGEFLRAIPPYTRALSLTNSYHARVSRGLAYLQMGILPAAEADCDEALRGHPREPAPLYFLGEIARQRGDTNAAIRFYQQYLSRAETGSAGARVAAGRLKEIQPAGP